MEILLRFTIWMALLSLGFAQLSIHKNSTFQNGKSSEGPSPLAPIHRRLSKDLFKNLNLTSNSNSAQKRSSGKVEILEAGSNLRTRGSPRVLKRGSQQGAPGAPGSRFADSMFTVKSSLKRNNGGYGPPVSFESAAGIPLVAIPGSNIPPPVYSYNGNLSPPAPPPSPSVTINGESSYGNGNPSPTVITYRPIGPGGGGGGTGGFSSTTSMPDIIFPPETPGPQPIRPPTGTSIPIIGGGGPGGGGGSVLPPSPPPEEIFPPAPPPDTDEFDLGVGRRLNLAGAPGAPGGFGAPGARGGLGAPGAPGGFGAPGATGGVGAPGASGGVGAPGAPGGSGVRTRTRFVSSSKTSPSASRFSSAEAFGPSSLSNLDRLRSGGNVRRERLRDKVKEFKTVEEVGQLPLSEEVDDPNVITDFVFSDIKCYKTRQDEYFGATIHMKTGFHLPYIRDRPQDPLISEECRLDLVEGTRGSYHMSVTDLRGCGVEQCGEAMCLTMVFPRVPMLALADDEVTTIKCIPQRSTMSDTKSISFAGDSTENRRSSSTVEGGIQEFVAEVGVFRQNPGSSNGLFVKRVNSGGVVQLGEPLQLRSVVRGTDGWKHSKLTDVKVWRMRDNLSPKLDNLDPNDASEVITLVDARGCRNDEYLVIADEHPIKDPRNDMVHHFTFKAFLFRGQRVNEPLIVTARVHACQEEQDCFMECGIQGRRKRSPSPVELHNASSIVHDYDSQLALRVVGLKDHPSSILDDDFPFEYTPVPQSVLNHTGIDNGSVSCNEKMFATGLGGGCIMLLICGLGLAIFTYIKQGKLNNSNSKMSPPAAHYRYPPPSGRPMNGPYQKPLPPPPTTASEHLPEVHKQLPSSINPNSSDKAARDDLAPVKRLLEEIISNNNNNSENTKTRNGGKSSSNKSDSGSKLKEPQSEYACIDETNSSSTSSASSSEDLRKSKRAKDNLYIVYCYDKDKKNNKGKLPMSAPSSTRLRRKHLRRMAEENDFDYEDEDFIGDRDYDSETMASQTEDPTDESDEYGELNGGNNNAVSNIVKNQAVRRTVREVKKKSKQNNVLAYASTRCAGKIRRRISSVYREGYLSGLRGVIQSASAAGSKGVGPSSLKHKKSPSTGNIPEIIAEEQGNGSGGYTNQSSRKRINFSVRERRSQRKRHQHYQQDHINQEQYSSEGMLSEANSVASTSDLDSAYSGSNCSKLTEVYEMKRGGGGGGNLKNVSGRHPDFRNAKLQQNRMDVQRQLIRSGASQGRNFNDKQEVRRPTSSPNNKQNASSIAVGHSSPPLPFGETKATHFVTRDDSTTKILIVPETHV